MSKHVLQQHLTRLMQETGVSYRALADELGLSLSGAYDRVRLAAGDTRATEAAILALAKSRQARTGRRPPPRSRFDPESVREQWAARKTSFERKIEASRRAAERLARPA